MAHAKEYSIETMLSKAWRLYRDNFSLILAIVLIVYIPINIVLGMLPMDNSQEGFRLYAGMAQLLEGIFGIISTMAIAFVVKYKLDDKKIDWQKAIEKSFSRWWPAIWTNLFVGILLIALFILLIVPGVIFAIYWAFVIYVVALFGKSGKEAMDRSKAIVKGRWWKVFLYNIIFGILILLVVGILSLFTMISDSYIFVLIVDTAMDVAGAYFIVLWTIFFLNFDQTKLIKNK